MRRNVLLAEVSRPPEPRLERSRGAAEIRFAPGAVGGIAHLYQRTPCRALFPRVEAGDPQTAVLLTTSGGITGGDRLEIAIGAEAGAEALATTQAAEKIYRSLGADATIELRLEAEAGATLEWLPQETILFDRARLVRRTAVVVAAGARLLALEMLVFGREAHGERLRSGRLLDSWRVKYDGRLVWADGLKLEGDLAFMLDRRAGFDGARALATLVYLAPDAPGRLELARELVEGAASRAGASVVGPVLIARFLGRDALALRRDVVRFVAGFRAAALGLPARLPRVWAT
ncbi:MAG TPA: urease accessory protein UreD [Alphaproteobacteria bacterium]|nr:urease accessory protein UreD [Alphaproteobacteria bacterium]